jgi:hypothetical protein
MNSRKGKTPQPESANTMRGLGFCSLPLRNTWFFRMTGNDLPESFVVLVFLLNAWIIPASHGFVKITLPRVYSALKMIENIV